MVCWMMMSNVIVIHTRALRGYSHMRVVHDQLMRCPVKLNGVGCARGLCDMLKHQISLVSY